MVNNISFVLGAVVIGAGIAISSATPEVVKEYTFARERSACWSPNVVTGLDDLAAQEALPSLKETYPENMSKQDQDAVSASFSVKLADYSYGGGSAASGTINCSASISYSYTRPDKTTYTHDNGDIISYSIQYSQYGWQAEMNGASIPSSLVSYNDDTQPSD